MISKLGRLNFKLTQSQVYLPKPNFQPIRTPPKILNFDLVWPEMGQTHAGPNLEQLNFEPRLVYKNQTKNSPGLSKNPEILKHFKRSKILSKMMHSEFLTHLQINFLIFQILLIMYNSIEYLYLLD